MKRIILLSALILITSFSFAQTQGELNDDAKFNRVMDILPKSCNEKFTNSDVADFYAVLVSEKGEKELRQITDYQVDYSFEETNYIFNGNDLQQEKFENNLNESSLIS